MDPAEERNHAREQSQRQVTSDFSNVITQEERKRLGEYYTPRQDIAGLFYTRCAELYAKSQAIIVMVMPHSTLTAPAAPSSQ